MSNDKLTSDEAVQLIEELVVAHRELIHKYKDIAEALNNYQSKVFLAKAQELESLARLLERII